MRSMFLVSVLALSLAATVHPANAAGVRIFVRHDVTDYAAWRKAYNEFDATRSKMGVTGKAVYQSTDNPNDVTVTHDFKTMEKAKAFAASPELKAAMDKAGVAGAPKMWFTTRVGGSASEAHGVRLFVHHTVTDYAAWRKTYDGFDATRRKLGVTGQAVYQSGDDPNDVVVTHDFKTIEAAKAFAASPELKEAMEKAGVSGTPDIWFTTYSKK